MLRQQWEAAVRHDKDPDVEMRVRNKINANVNSSHIVCVMRQAGKSAQQLSLYE